MKNTNFKTKLIARIMLLVLLLASALSFAGCGRVPDGYYDPYDFEYYLSQNMRGDDATILKIWATSNKNVFDTNNITFILLYGTHANQYVGRQDTKFYDLERYLEYGTRKYEDYTFALYICDWTMEHEDVFYENIYDIENIVDHEFIKSINAEEAFSEEYGYIVENWFLLDGFLYNHIESITIPKEYIKENRGRFVIKLVAFYENSETEQYLPQKVEDIVFEYEKIDVNTVKINFHEKDKGERR